MGNQVEKWAGAALAQVSLLQELSVKAGLAVMEIYRQDFEVMEKADSSPLTRADLAANGIITRGLKNLPGRLGGIPIISEENDIPEYGERAGWEAWWLIDPLDGTKEFVSRNGEFTVNIALIVRESSGAPGIPAAGWVYAPVPAVLYQGISGCGALRFDVRDKAAEISLPCSKPASSPRIVASRSHRNPETEDVIKAVGERFGKGEIISSGSSLKLCRIAEGSAELYPRPAPTMEWDTAAADAVCRAAGARVVDAHSGKNLEYGKENLLNPWFLVSRDERLISLAVKVLGELQRYTSPVLFTISRVCSTIRLRKSNSPIARKPMSILGYPQHHFFCVCRIMAITRASQARDVGSIPIRRST